MKLSRVKRVLTKRLAWLTAKADGAPATAGLAEERDALATLLRCQGMLDQEKVARHIAVCEARVLPAEQRTIARARRGDELAVRVAELVDQVASVARVA